jgi:hypothetical protein
MRIVGINNLCAGPVCRRHADSGAANEAEVSALSTYQPSASGVGCLVRPDAFSRIGSLITNFRSQIAAFLIVTPAIRNTFNSFSCSKSVQSNRHSPPILLSPNFAGVTL